MSIRALGGSDPVLVWDGRGSLHGGVGGSGFGHGEEDGEGLGEADRIAGEGEDCGAVDPREFEVNGARVYPDAEGVRGSEGVGGLAHHGALPEGMQAKVAIPYWNIVI